MLPTPLIYSNHSITVVRTRDDFLCEELTDTYRYLSIVDYFRFLIMIMNNHGKSMYAICETHLIDSLV